MKTEGVNVPDFIGGSYASVVEFYAVVGGRNIVPGPIAVQPIVEILLINFNSEKCCWNRFKMNEIWLRYCGSNAGDEILFCRPLWDLDLIQK